MKTKVFIPYKNDKVFRAFHSRRNKYNPDFSTWMIETFGQVSGGMWGTEPRLLKGYINDGMTFWFKEPSHAMMFKLTWA